MFDHTHYVPILKGKLGERGALEVIDPTVKTALTPLIEIPPIPWDHENDTEAKTIDAHLAATAAQLKSCWGTTDRFFLDFNLLPPGVPMTSGNHPVETVLGDARAEGLQGVPVTGLARGQDYQDAVRDAVALDDRGACKSALSPRTTKIQLPCKPISMPCSRTCRWAPATRIW